MTFTEAATLVLRLVGKPLHYKEITDVAIERSLLSHVGKSPEVTMGARLAAQVKKNEKDNPLKRVKPGVFALADWDESLIEKGLKDRTPALERLAKAEAEKKKDGEEPVEGTDLAVEADQAPLAQHTEVDEEMLPPDEEEKHRAELSAGAKELFESEEDDDQPIFGTPSSESSSDDSDQGEEKSGGKRRRRRRRGKKRDDENGDDGSEDLPSYTVSDAPATEQTSSEESSSSLVDDATDASLGDALEKALARFDKGKGAVSAQNLADSLKRAGQGDVGGPATVLAVAEADRLASERQGRLPRFRITGHKVALTSWSLDKKSGDKYQALTRAVRQMEQATTSSLLDQLQRLPQRAFGELVVVLLSRMGLTDISAVKRPGSHGSELHLAGRMKLFGQEPHAKNGAGIQVAVVVRRDGKDIGRERVTELRGALHHYGPAACGWIISAGQVLSGAREEAAAPGGSPVTLTGKHELAELCLTHGVGVVMQRIECPTLDVGLFEGLSGR